ncbi:MAG TPA: DUF4214 domain-containing protein [Paucimonas sp.]|nr:DUF4214 domain-containing protein [Paucimonas sp.]
MNQARQAAIVQSVPAPVSYQRAVHQLYIAYLGRPAEPAGLANFTAVLVSASAPADIRQLAAAYYSNQAVRNVVDAFGDSAESNALYAGNTIEFVAAIYRNLLNREPQLEGLRFWSNAIDSGALTRGHAALSILAGALASTTAQGLKDAKTIDNKVAVAVKFTSSLEGIIYVGNDVATVSRAMLTQVSDATPPSAFRAIADAALERLGVVGFDSIDIGARSGIQQERTVIIEDRAAWAGLWAEHKRFDAAYAEVPSIDFDERIVLGVFMGSRTTACHSIRIVVIHRSGQNNVVEYRENTPSSAELCGEALVSPAHLVSVPRSPYPYVFVKQ